MGVAVPGDAATSAEISGVDDSDEVGNEDESIVHNTASVGDVEVIMFCISLIWCFLVPYIVTCLLD